MPQVASSVSSGRPYRKRMTLRSSTMPTSADAANATGTAATQVEVERAGRVRAEQVLHDVRRVRADHDELAVRHVDDAHQAVGDRETQRGEQQDAAEAHAAEHAADHLAGREPALDRAQRKLGFGADVAVGLGELAALLLEQRQEQRLGVRVAAFRQRADRSEPRRLVAARELDRRLGQRQQRLDLGILLLLERALDRRQHVLVGAALQLLAPPRAASRGPATRA